MKRLSRVSILTLNRRRMLATMIDTELAAAPITPTILSGLVKIGGSPLAQRTSDPSLSIKACTNVRDCSRAYVSLEQVSKIRAPSVMLGNSSGSLLIRSMANIMASKRWMPFSFFSSPHGVPRSPLACTGNNPPSIISPSSRMEWAYSGAAWGSVGIRWGEATGMSQVWEVATRRKMKEGDKG